MDSLEDEVKEIIANGCGCDRKCQELVGPDVFCGCMEDASKIIDVVVMHVWKME
jgi:hypothetical protein